MDIRAEENKLFQKWIDNTHVEDFVFDGVVNPSEWYEMPIRIVFLLKETNGFRDDLRVFLDSGGRWMTWNNVARWTYALRQMYIKDVNPQWESVNRINKEKRKYNLRKVAVINVKKQMGGTTTNTVKLIEIFRKYNKEFFVEQLNMLGHIDFLICCGKGVATCVEESVNEELLWKRIRSGVRRATTLKGTVVVDFFHPQSRYRSKELFLLFCEAVSPKYA
ncbi:MAG: hypothetical protein IJV44_06555 [Prevotella sp.]|nr:hypothetical protein [Prevotella sp.]